MADTRAAKSGFAAEAQRKIKSKYSVDTAAEAMRWIKEVTKEDFSTDGSEDNVYEVLKDGKILCKLVNELKPGSVKRVQTGTMSFQCMENISAFVTASIELGVLTQDTFQSTDLWERVNLNAVIICLQSLGRKGGNFGKPSIGPKESDKNVRNFSEEQLKAGDGIIGLQYGTNKGANQSGISFGNTRHM